MEEDLARRAPGDPIRRVLLLFEGRAGSSMLFDVLQAIPEVELPLDRYPEAPHEMLAPLRSSPGEQHRVVEEFFGPPSRPGVRCQTFKTKLSDVCDPSRLAATVRALGLSVLYLQRRNLVKHVVSSIRAVRLSQQFEQTGQEREYNIRREQDRVPSAEIFPHEFLEWVLNLDERVRRLEEFLGHLAVPVTSIAYEDLFLGDPEALAALRQAFGTPDLDLGSSAYKKHTSDRLQDVILNYRDLEESLAPTPLFSQLASRAPDRGPWEARPVGGGSPDFLEVARCFDQGRGAVPCGYLDALIRGGRWLRLRGWAAGPGGAPVRRVHLYRDGRPAWGLRPWLRREDVEQALGLEPGIRVGFDLLLPGEGLLGETGADLRLVAELEGGGLAPLYPASAADRPDPWLRPRFTWQSAFGA